MRWLEASPINGHEFEQAPGVGDGQGSLVCCSPWACKESDMTKQLINNNNTTMCKIDNQQKPTV